MTLPLTALTDALRACAADSPQLGHLATLALAGDERALEMIERALERLAVEASTLGARGIELP